MEKVDRVYAFINQDETNQNKVMDNIFEIGVLNKWLNVTFLCLSG